MQRDHWVSESVNDRLYGWITFDIADDDSIRIDGVSERRLYADFSHLTDGMCDRAIFKLYDETRGFLWHVGRATAVGAAISAIERIEDVLQEVQHDTDT